MTTKLAIVFPGQGSQSVGMLADLYQQYPLVQQTFAEASNALGYDLWALVAQGPEADLNETHRTQPALLTASVAVWRLWQQQGGATPAYFAGHSLGEYSALVCAGEDLAYAELERRAELLALRDRLQGQRGLARGFRTVDLHDATLGQATDTEGDIQHQRTGGDDLDRFDDAVAHAHHGALAELLFDLAQGGGEGTLLVLVHGLVPRGCVVSGRQVSGARSHGLRRGRHR